MLRVALFILTACACFADVAAIDSQGYVVEVCTGTTSPSDVVFSTPGVTAVVPSGSFKDGGLSALDQFGRCLYKASQGGPYVSVAPHWPADAQPKLALKKRVFARVDALNQSIASITAWQADYRLVALFDRSAELTQAQNRLTNIINALNGP